MLRSRHLVMGLAAGALLLGTAGTLHAQTPATSPDTAAASAAPATPDPFEQYFLASALQQSDLPAGMLMEIQIPLPAAALADAKGEVALGFAPPQGAFLQAFASYDAINTLTSAFVGSAPLGGSSSPSIPAMVTALPAVNGPILGISGQLVMASPDDASTVIAFAKAGLPALLNGMGMGDLTGATGTGDSGSPPADLSITPLTAPGIGDEAVEFELTRTSTDTDTGATMTEVADVVLVRRGRVVFGVSVLGEQSQQAAAEGLATALDRHAQNALIDLPVQ